MTYLLSQDLVRQDPNTGIEHDSLFRMDRQQIREEGLCYILSMCILVVEFRKEREAGLLNAFQ